MMSFPLGLLADIIYVITPTYYRSTQIGDLLRLAATLRLVDNIHWIVVEDSNNISSAVKKLVKDSTVNFTLLNYKTPPSANRIHRGVHQRNFALKTIRSFKVSRGVVYFADDDNTYDKRIFNEMRNTQKVSIWPVGFAGGVDFEGPVVRNKKIVKWKTGFARKRKFPTDMASFAFNVTFLSKSPMPKIPDNAKHGHLETDFLMQLINSSDELESKAEDCSKVLVWHTKTMKQKLN
ncbi:galactosylgalactosylxylosylprotein 3-beta-glucuronosyltransferase 3-like [Zophobas morio]|uniref:galactosylgalactosylxylosylprotein 3-beta-glucuronosyltransferase 3-like n=1 Tax=Zophobas morio TaxID=2755281 RepID=UPI00308305B0